MEGHLACTWLLQIFAAEKKENTTKKCIFPSYSGLGLYWTTVCQGRLQGSTLTLRARLCSPTYLSFGGSSILIVIFFPLSFLSSNLSSWQHSNTHYPCVQSWGICEQTRGLSTVPKCMFFHLEIHNNLYQKYTTLFCSLFPLLFPRRSPAGWWGIEKATSNQVL